MRGWTTWRVVEQAFDKGLLVFEIVDSDLLDVIADDARLMPHLHLSLQSGDDMILKRMKRRHLRDDSIRFCEEARRLRPDVR